MNPASHGHGLDRKNQTQPIGVAVLVMIVALVVVEIAFQVRAQKRTGESVFSLMRGETTYVKHPRLDVRILRPTSVIKGTKQIIETNRYGLRDEDFEPVPPVGERRIALLGASTIMGAYAPTNRETSSAALERVLNNGRNGSGHIRVVNAGLGGTTLQAQTRIMTGMLPDLGVTHVIWYPGSNDIGCSKPAKVNVSTAIHLPWPDVPKWALTSDMIVKNTAFLRRSNAASSSSLIPNFDQSSARQQIEQGVLDARNAHLAVVLVTSATSFRTDMPPELIASRAASLLFFRPCYSGPELAAAVDELNTAMREVAQEHGIPLIDAARLLPPDPTLFGDGSHFSIAGEEAFAAVIAREMGRQRLMKLTDPP